VILIEEIFEIPSGDAENFGSPREIVDWLESHLSNQRPDRKAAAFLRKLAQTQNNPELAGYPQGAASLNGKPLSCDTHCAFLFRTFGTN
jgi:hypothetical protein